MKSEKVKKKIEKLTRGGRSFGTVEYRTINDVDHAFILFLSYKTLFGFDAISLVWLQICPLKDTSTA